jgi:hypothetical protein
MRRTLALLAGSLSAALSLPAHADWQRTDKALSWTQGDEVVWRFSYDADKGKPFFDPLSIDGTRLTNFRPEDHPWHYGLWFSWKYINGANYWEEDRESGQAQGKTRWRAPQIQTRDDGSATIQLALTYTHPGGRVDLTETRSIDVSPTDANGGYTIDWRSQFVAGPAGATLDRTPMPGEPQGQVNGGYAGLAARLAAAPLVMSIVTPAGSITRFERDRARPNAPAVAANFTDRGRPAGSIAILADPANIAQNAPWYLINAAEGMRFVCSAVLAPAIKKLAPNERWDLNYRIVVQAQPFTPEGLGAAISEWRARGE